ncbi:MAG: NAD(P)H-binding protein, partial [Rhodanobacteraceae bacterium]
LDYTIVRPGRLTNEAACGRVALDTRLQDHGEVPRADVAAVLLEVLKTPDAIGKTFEVLKGEKPIEQAVSQL